MKLLSVNPLSLNSQKHNAFTDFVKFKNAYYICYREAQNHVSKDGLIRILKSLDLLHWQTVSILKFELSDLRDPKLSVSPKNQLALLFYHKQYDSAGALLSNLSKVSFSQTGDSWGTPITLSENKWWLWRLTWLKEAQAPFALGVAYNRASHCVRLYAGDPGRSFKCIQPELFSLRKNGKGYPNESEVIFLADGTALCLLRRDVDTGSAQLGVAKSPYKRWQWIDLRYYLGGPAMLQLSNGEIWIAARLFTKRNKPVTALLKLALSCNNVGEYRASLTPTLKLPSAGDNSYPGLLEDNGHLFVSYYSEHQGQSSHVYLAKLAIGGKISS
ncbi:sialidase family protein [Algibacillus agarilyticus]|uniref:sialidase family protein n=1 Tax=Algibacillus agarilyticus TaxID=2234133 RepID=UPI000DCFA2E0|nr:sialidase family protein [Algibacillus agarilyticus]